jgi:hypothetical protein
MPFIQIPTPWSADPLHCAVVWYSGGLIAWTLLAALVACLWGIVRECERPRQPVLRRSLRVVPAVRPWSFQTRTRKRSRHVVINS